MGTGEKAAAVGCDRSFSARGAFTHAGPAVLSLLLASWVMDFGKADLRVPLVYHDDSLLLLRGTDS